MLRIAPAVPVGLPRVVPPSGAVITGVRIPGGVRVSHTCPPTLLLDGVIDPPQTVVSQSALFVHLSEQIFPRPHEFLPERWLQPGSRALENFLVPFSKGPRRCLGIK
jgi:hypothetical protein